MGPLRHGVPVPGGVGGPVGPALVVLAGQNHVPGSGREAPKIETENDFTGNISLSTTADRVYITVKM